MDLRATQGLALSFQAYIDLTTAWLLGVFVAELFNVTARQGRLQSPGLAVGAHAGCHGGLFRGF